MAVDEKTLGKMGKEIAQSVGDGCDPRRLRNHGLAFQTLVQSRGRQRRKILSSKPIVLIVATSLLLCIAIPVVVVQSTNESIDFRVGNDSGAGETGAWVQASGSDEVPVQFDGGSIIRLKRNGALRIVESSKKEVVIELSNGRLEASIQGNKATRWTVHAGPYLVRVLGTKFSLNWKHQTSSFKVVVDSGVVSVTGIGIDEDGLKLNAGQSLVGNARQQSILVESSSQTSPAKEEQPHGEPDLSTTPADESIGTREHHSKSRPLRKPGHRKSKLRQNDLDSPSPTWEEFYRNEEYAKAVRAAEAHGITNLSSTLDKAALWKLADAARNAGRIDIALETLVAYRKRFKSSKRSRTAAFLLGRLNIEKRRDHGRAQSWFQTYLKEEPNGPLAEEALGRLMSLYSQTGNRAQAKQAAIRYLKKYPKGPFSPVARNLSGDY